jgi:hypothetical protein
VGPLASEIERAARESEGWPSYLEAPEYGPAVRAWARAEAVLELLTAYVSERDIGDALTEVYSEDVDERHSKGRTRRVSSARRTMAAVEMTRRNESVAMHLRDRLGLSPLARSRIDRDVAAAKLDLGAMWAREPDGGI